MDLFPYKPRRNQKEIMQTIARVLESEKDFVFESGTGSGKTVCALSATIAYALKHQKKIIYTTRTNAQQRQVILELRAIRKKMKKDKDKVSGVGIQGRANMCILARKNPEFSKGTAEELSRLCTNEKKKVLTRQTTKKGCMYFRNFKNNKEIVENTIEWMKEELPTAEECIEYCEKHRICPYELNKMLIQEARVVVVPYVYVFDSTIRMKLFEWLAVPEEDVILIVDEAHNIPDYLRELFSAELSMWMLTSCLSEAEKFGDPPIGDGKTSVSTFCKLLIDIITDLRDTYIYGKLEDGTRANTMEKNDAFIPSHEMESELLTRLALTSKTLRDIMSDLIAYGEKIQEYREKEGSLPRSYLHKLGVFLEFWTLIEMDQYIKLVVDDSGGKNPRIEAYCLDPSVGTSILREVHSSLHMSGTLEPLEEYRDSLGLSDEETELVSYPSPFPRENRLVLFARDVTTKYEEIASDKTMVSRLGKLVTDICNAFPKNTIVFFPSFNMLSMFRNTGVCDEINRCLFVEEREMSQAELMDLVMQFKASSGKKQRGAALFSVIGGRISEGMDFPAEQLEIAVIVGLPYPKPTARQRGLQRYYDLKFGKGWEYTVDAPTARKLLQSIGRLIRDEKDRGVAVILDKRASRFKQYIHDLHESKDVLGDIQRFLGT